MTRLTLGIYNRLFSKRTDAQINCLYNLYKLQCDIDETKTNAIFRKSTPSYTICKYWYSRVDFKFKVLRLNSRLLYVCVPPTMKTTGV